jgi:hypothetical protein
VKPIEPARPIEVKEINITLHHSQNSQTPHVSHDPAYDDEPVEEIIEAPKLNVKPDSGEAKWAKAVESLRNASPRHGKSLSHARFLGFGPEGVRVWFPPDAAFHKAQITGMSRNMVEAELVKAFGPGAKLIEETQTPAQVQAAPASIAEVELQSRTSREKAIELKVKQHPAVLNILRHLGGSVEHISYLDPPEKKPNLSAPEDPENPGSPDVSSSD